MKTTNHTTYDIDMINDSVRVLTARYKVLIIVSTLILAVIPVHFVVKYGIGRSGSILVITAAGILIVLIAGIMRIRAYRSNLMSRLRVINHSDKVECEYSIDEEMISVTRPNASNTLYHSDIKKIFETKKQYIILYSGNAFILVAKNGFDGNGEQIFRKILKR